jgi:hypothetical protein
LRQLDAIAAEALGLVERFVGRGDEIVMLDVGAGHKAANADTQLRVIALDLVGAAADDQIPANPFGEVRRISERGVRQQDGEFVAAVARAQI